MLSRNWLRVAFDAETVEIYAGAELPAAGEGTLQTHPSIAFELLSRIPRLELVAAMVAGQQNRPAEHSGQQQPAAIEPGELGANLLKIAMAYDQLLFHGMRAKDAIRKLKNEPKEYYFAAVDALETLSTQVVPFTTEGVSVRELSIGMILDEDLDLRSSSGMLSVARNQEISYLLMIRIRNFLQKDANFPGYSRKNSPARNSCVGERARIQPR